MTNQELFEFLREWFWANGDYWDQQSIVTDYGVKFDLLDLAKAINAVIAKSKEAS